MQYLAVLRRRTETFSDAEFAPLLEAEAARARELHASGAFRMIYSRVDVPGAVIFVEASDVEEATALLEQLPLLARGMLELTLVPLRAYRGFVGG
jgi:muconolactone delta-isomerase